MGDDARPECLEWGGDATGDSPVPDESDGQSGEPADGAKVVDAPRPGPNRIVGHSHLAKRGEDQGEGVGGDLLHGVVGNVGDDYPGICGGTQIDVVEADPVTGDDLALLEACDRLGGPGQVGIEDGVGVGRGGQDRLDIPGSNREFRVDLCQKLPLDLDRGEDLVTHHDLISRQSLSRLAPG